MDKTAIELLKFGVLEVKENGEIWRHAKLSRTGSVIAILPVRAEKITDKGYLCVRWGQRGFIFAHQLVWIFHHGFIPEGVEINHKDGVKHNNNISNLELLTHGENIKHAYDHGLRTKLTGEKNPNFKVTMEVREVIVGMRKNKMQIAQIANTLKINRFTVRLILKEELPEMTGHIDRAANLKGNDALPWVKP